MKKTLKIKGEHHDARFVELDRRTCFSIVDIGLPRVAGVGDALDAVLGIAHLQRPQRGVRLGLGWNDVNGTLKMCQK